MDDRASIRILLADDHEMVRSGLRALLRQEPGVEVVAEAQDGRTAVRLAAELAPDLVIMDVSMPDLNGVEATRQIRADRSGRGPRVIALSAHTNPRFTTEMLKAGASGYVFKEAAFEELAAALKCVLAGRIYLGSGGSNGATDGGASGAAGDDEAAGSPGRSAYRTLSPREREILQLMAEGHGVKAIALRLSISAKTVETHRSNVKEKLGLDSVAELTKYAVREGLTTL